jgi:UPF0755 protein
MKKIVIFTSIVILGLSATIAYGLWFKTSDTEIIFSISEDSKPAEMIEQWPFDSFWKQSFIAGCALKRLNHIPAGKYKISADMTPIDVIHLLRKKEQIDILIRIDKANQSDSLFQVLSQELGQEATQYQETFDSVFHAEYAEPNANIRTTYFFADTYAFTYGEKPKKTATRFHQFYLDFWTIERLTRLKEVGLNKEEVYILASMVKGETKDFSEAATIAGLYINRLRKPMKLQCDATVKYALALKNAQRILKQDLNLNSPYNTYLIDGLPPGPIFITEKKYLDAVLQFEKHNFVYMCAKDDGSGKHLFTSSFDEHQNNAKKYQKYLNDLNIKR